MYKTVNGYCELQKKNVEIEIECIPADTYEGIEYAKAGIKCKYDPHHACKRNECSIWKHFHP